MTKLRLAMMVLLAGAMVVSACGRKGEPLRPDAQQEEQESS